MREGCDIPLIAETGGQNALIVDSSALPEQVVQDVLSSAFDSAGQRCSALRVLFLLCCAAGVTQSRNHTVPAKIILHQAKHGWSRWPSYPPTRRCEPRHA